MSTINSLEELRCCVRLPYQRDTTQFFAAVQRGEGSIRHMLGKAFATVAIDVEAIQKELIGGIDQLIGAGDEQDEGNV